jgi:hypothetical protein
LKAMPGLFLLSNVLNNLEFIFELFYHPLSLPTTRHIDLGNL